MKSNLIAGIGSPHGDDQIGWHLVEYLRRNPSKIDASSVSLFVARDPVDLMAQLDGVRRLVVVDGCQMGREVGEIMRLQWPDPGCFVRHSHSTHHVSLIQTLQLAEALNRMPSQVVLYGIEIASALPGDQLSPCVAAALPELARRITEEISHSTSDEGLRD
jgi:hydrogenase maturation protease